MVDSTMVTQYYGYFCKMKSFFVLCVVLAAVRAEYDHFSNKSGRLTWFGHVMREGCRTRDEECAKHECGQSVPLPQAQNEKANQYAAECIKETGVKPEVLAEAKKGHISDDEHLKKFTLCFFKKAGIVSNDGKLNVDVALAKLPPGVNKADAEKLLETCKGKAGKDVTDTVFEIFKCYHHGTKTHILLGF